MIMMIMMLFTHGGVRAPTSQLAAAGEAAPLQQQQAAAVTEW